MVGYVGETSHKFSAQGISVFLLATGRIQKGTKDSDQSDSQRGFHSEVIREPCAARSSCILKINNKDVYVDYGATEDIPENACNFRRQYYGWRFEAALN